MAQFHLGGLRRDHRLEGRLNGEKTGPRRGEFARLDVQRGEVVVAADDLQLRALGRSLQRGEGQGGVAIADQPLALGRPVPAALGDVTDPKLRLPALEEHVGVAGVADGEGGGAGVGGGEGLLGFGVAGLFHPHLADLRQGLGLPG